MSASEQEHHDGPHVSPIGNYFKVFGALCVLTILTVTVSQFDLGAVGIIPAMLIAIIKGSLVIAFFMHLRYDGGFLNVILFTSVFFMLVFFGWVMVDLSSRGMLVPENGLYYFREQQGLVTDAPKTLTEEGHQLPAAYINEERAAKIKAAHGGEGHDNPSKHEAGGGHGPEAPKVPAAAPEGGGH